MKKKIKTAAAALALILCLTGMTGCGWWNRTSEAQESATGEVPVAEPAEDTEDPETDAEFEEAVGATAAEAQIMVPDEPVEEMTPGESSEIEMEEDLNGSF